MAGRGSGWKKEGKRIRKTRGITMPEFQIPSWMEWYDMVMIPVLLIAAILVIINLEEVLLAFFKVTVVLMDFLFVLILIVGIGVAVRLMLRNRRRW